METRSRVRQFFSVQQSTYSIIYKSKKKKFIKHCFIFEFESNRNKNKIFHFDGLNFKYLILIMFQFKDPKIYNHLVLKAVI